MANRIDETNARCMEYALKHSLLARSKLAIILKNATTGETEYCCVQCSAKYNEKVQMEQHLCMHNKQYKFLCGICGTGLKRKEHLDRHLLEHGELRPHKCPNCGKAFKRKEHLTIHKTIHNEKDQACTLCDRSFHRKDHLQKHLQTHGKLFLEQNLFPLDDQEALEMAGEEFHIKEEAVEQYDVDASYEDCEMGSSDPLDGEYADDVKPSADVRTPDAHVARPHMCPVCFKSYKRRDHLKIHSWTHMKKDKICSGCGKGYHKETQLSMHMSCCVHVHMRLRAEQLGDSSLRDTSDGGDMDIMVDNSLLVESRRLRTDPESRPHECPVCHRRFKRKQHLKVHSNVHLKQEASIWCSLCNEGFVANKQFEQHQCRAGAAPPTPEAKKENKYPTEQFVEEMVEESPTSPSYVMVPDEQSIPVPQRVFVCRFCQKPFKRRDHYKIHLHIHTGVKDFFCPDCGKGFYRKDHLQKHSQTHSKPKPKPKKQLPGLYPISVMQKKAAREVKPEITITAPSNTKLRVPLQIKVPYQVVLSGADGLARAVTVDPHSAPHHEIFT